MSLLLLFGLSPAFKAQEEREPRAEESEHHNSEVDFWRWTNFAVLAGILAYFIYKRSGPFFDARSVAIRSAIDESARLRKEAEQRAAAAEDRLSNLAHEIDSLRAASKNEMAAEGERVRLQSAWELRKIQENAERDITAAASAARRELKAYSAGLAVAMAEQKIRACLTPEIERSLVGFFLAELYRDAGRGPGGKLN